MRSRRDTVRSSLAIAMLLFLPTTALSQVVLDFNSFQMSLGDTWTFEGTSGPVAISPGPAGGGQTWDFSAIPTEFDLIVTYVNPSLSPGGENYPTANVCQQIPFDGGAFYQYFLLDGSGLNPLGSAYWMDPPGTTWLMEVDSTGPMFISPISYGAQWSTTITHYDFGGEIAEVDVRNYHADAWGAVTTSAGTLDCLRLKLHRVTTHYDGGIPGETEENWAYEWMSPDWGTVCIVRHEDGNPSPDFVTGELDVVTETGHTLVRDSSWGAIKAMY